MELAISPNKDFHPKPFLLQTTKRPSGRRDFPKCASCRYVSKGPWTICIRCTSERLPESSDLCPVCSQKLDGKPCQNSLCKEPSRHISRISAITLPDRFDPTVRNYKNGTNPVWGIIFARLLFGYLEMNWSPDEVDIILANPPNPGRDHTTRVVRLAKTISFGSRWPFDCEQDPAIIKETLTEQSAGHGLDAKRIAAQNHAEALELKHPNRIKGKRVIVYDDICTTGYQLNEVARRLKEWGALEVWGIVLARQPWGTNPHLYLGH